MSGGHFDYKQSHIESIADDLEEILADGYYAHYSNEVKAQFRDGLEALRKAYAYTHRIDRLLSGDASEDTFLEALAEDLKSINDELNPKRKYTAIVRVFTDEDFTIRGETNLLTDIHHDTKKDLLVELTSILNDINGPAKTYFKEKVIPEVTHNILNKGEGYYESHNWIIDIMFIENKD